MSNKASKRLPLRRQYCSLAEDESVLITIVLMRLRNFYRAQVGLPPDWSDTIPEVVIAHLFLAGYEHYHGCGVDAATRWERCKRDFLDFIGGKIDLERYLMSAYEDMLKGKLASHPATDERTRFLEGRIANRLWDVDLELAHVLLQMEAPLPPTSMGSREEQIVAKVIVEGKTNLRVTGPLPESTFLLPQNESDSIVPFAEEMGAATM